MVDDRRHFGPQDAAGELVNWPRPRPLNPPLEPAPDTNPRERKLGAVPPLMDPAVVCEPLPLNEAPPRPRMGPMCPFARGAFVVCAGACPFTMPFWVCTEEAATEATGAPPRTRALPRPRFGLVIIWTGPLWPGPFWAGAGRNPAAGRSPGAGWTDGWGPKRGLNGAVGFWAVGELGFVDARNWGFERLRHDQNSTVEPRYWEHLSLRVVPDMKGASQMMSIDLAFMPTTTPLKDSGTPPESWTIVTRSPRAKCWFWRR